MSLRSSKRGRVLNFGGAFTVRHQNVSMCVGETLSVVFYQSAGTPYNWQYASSDTDVKVEGPTHKSKNRDPHMCGGKETLTWTIVPLREVDTILEFHFRRYGADNTAPNDRTVRLGLHITAAPRWNWFLYAVRPT